MRHYTFIMLDKQEIGIENLCHLYRPQATQMVITRHKESGTLNLAPYNIVIPLDDKHILIGPRAWNDTDLNIRSNGIFSVNLATRDMVEHVLVAAKKFPPDRSEIDELSIANLSLRTYLPDSFPPDGLPGIQNAAVSVWCELQPDLIRELPEKFGSRSLLVGKIIHSETDFGDDLSTQSLLYAGSGEFTMPIPVRTTLEKEDAPSVKNPLQIPQNLPLISVGSGEQLQVGFLPTVIEVSKYPPAFLLGADISSDLFKGIVKHREFALSLLSLSQWDDEPAYADTPETLDFSLPHAAKDNSSTPIVTGSPINYWCILDDEDLEKAILINDKLLLFAAKLKKICCIKNAYEYVQTPNAQFSRMAPEVQPLMIDNLKQMFIPDIRRKVPFKDPTEYLDWLESMRICTTYKEG